MKCSLCDQEYELGSYPHRTRFRGFCGPCALFARERSKHEARWRRFDYRPEAYDLFVDVWHREPRMSDYSFLHPRRRRAARRRVAVWKSSTYLHDRELAQRLDVCQPWVGKLRRRLRPGSGPADRYLAYGMDVG